jgi:hypothetical protein
MSSVFSTSTPLDRRCARPHRASIGFHSSSLSGWLGSIGCLGCSSGLSWQLDQYYAGRLSHGKSQVSGHVYMTLPFSVSEERSVPRNLESHEYILGLPCFPSLESDRTTHPATIHANQPVSNLLVAVVGVITRKSAMMKRFRKKSIWTWPQIVRTSAIGSCKLKRY